MNTYIKKFSEIGIEDISTVGGKNASLGEMYSKLSSKGIAVPDGFAYTVSAFKSFLTINQLDNPIKKLMLQLDKVNYSNLKEIGASARKLIMNATLTKELENNIINAYKELSNGVAIEVAVRSSATAEDLPNASFAGQHESFLNIKGEKDVLVHYTQTGQSNIVKTIISNMNKYFYQWAFRKWFDQIKLHQALDLRLNPIPDLEMLFI